MMEMTICIIAGLVVGIIIGILISKSQKNSAAAKLMEEKQQLATRNEVLKNQMDEKAELYAQMLKAQDERHNASVAAMKETFDKTVEQLKSNLQASTEDLLKSRQEEFSDVNRRNMQGIIGPLNETIAKMETELKKYSQEQSEFKGSMKENIDMIVRQTETARQSAMELTTALKHDTKVQGDYGEAILDEILSRQGFTKGIHYETQFVMRDDAGKELKGDDGKGLRPDVLFHIDTKRDVIIDSKINLTEFIEYANAETPEERRIHLSNHVKSVEAQIKLLSQKNYFKYHKKTNARMDYVIMFIPISAAWWEALRVKPDLWREAMESNVYIADEQTLFAALRIIKLTWTQIGQMANQTKIFELANQMIDRVGQFMAQYKAIGAALDKAKSAYDAGNSKLTPGGQSILTTSKNLLELGARDSKTHPVQNFIDVDDVAPLPEPQSSSTDD